mmetsp:Transcript_7582/g.13663  ORF Transcript_7582/g.13663 Transcript_7582/m.13663 type:complete len:223 (-) Transcript_7582:109-777(-)
MFDYPGCVGFPGKILAVVGRGDEVGRRLEEEVQEGGPPQVRVQRGGFQKVQDRLAAVLVPRDVGAGQDLPRLQFGQNVGRRFVSLEVVERPDGQLEALRGLQQPRHWRRGQRQVRQERLERPYRHPLHDFDLDAFVHFPLERQRHLLQFSLEDGYFLELLDPLAGLLHHLLLDGGDDFFLDRPQSRIYDVVETRLAFLRDADLLLGHGGHVRLDVDLMQSVL